MARFTCALMVLTAAAAAAGNPIGTSQLDLAGPACRFPDAAFSVTSDRYLVVWTDYTQSPTSVCGTFLDPEGGRIGSPFCLSNPAAAALLPACFVDSSGALGASSLELAATADFEGDTLFGGDVACAPFAGRCFVSFATSRGHAGQELNEDGAVVSPRAIMGEGDDMALSNAVDPRRARFLGVWESLVGSSHYVRMRLYQADDVCSPASPSLSAGWLGDEVRLQWSAPPDLDVSRVIVRASTTAPPQTVGDGVTVLDAPAGASSSADAHWMPAMDAATVYLAAFTLDSAQNSSAPVGVQLERSVVPEHPPGMTTTGAGACTAPSPPRTRRGGVALTWTASIGRWSSRRRPIWRSW